MSDLALIQTPILLTFKCLLVGRSILNNLIYTTKVVRSVSKQDHLQPSLSFKGQVTEQTTVKWSTERTVRLELSKSWNHIQILSSSANDVLCVGLKIQIYLWETNC